MVYRVKQCSRCTGADLPLNERNWVVTLLSLNVNSNFKANCKIVFYLSSGNCVSHVNSDNPDKGVARLFDIKVLIKLLERFALLSS